MSLCNNPTPISTYRKLDADSIRLHNTNPMFKQTQSTRPRLDIVQTARRLAPRGPVSRLSINARLDNADNVVNRRPISYLCSSGRMRPTAPGRALAL
ncbi:hypothetical protein EVAR_36088_1 [Eumeta japonica]|uniref:Uncharacterized protein n=1 Tax=Eumeta variegata TaxID=151549 RepID=A0A4C1YHZ0_EUMVA|nr:hypothetical protein EVAR_36088_1 [Eumeta japonica]